MKRILIFILTLIFVLFFIANVCALCIDVTEANLRSGPGTKYEKTWKVFKYMPLQQISKERNWYKVKDIEGDVHWVYRKQVTNKFKCAVVKVNVANIRSGPAREYKTVYISPAMKYESFKVITNKELWVNVQDEFNNTGWIFRKLLWIQ
jgi:SH3-like domain-containing protein